MMKSLLFATVCALAVALLEACCIPDTARLDYIWTNLRKLQGDPRDSDLELVQTGSITADFVNQRFLLSRDSDAFTSQYFADLKKGEITWHYKPNEGDEQCFRIATDGVVGMDYRCIMDNTNISSVELKNKYSADLNMVLYPLEAKATMDLRSCLPDSFRAKSMGPDDRFWFPVLVTKIDHQFKFENVSTRIDPRVLEPPCQADIFPGPVRRIPTLQDLAAILNREAPPIDPDEYISSEDYEDLQRWWWGRFGDLEQFRTNGNVAAETEYTFNDDV